MTTVRSFAKINLGLRIGPPRPDGFHHLHTLYQTIGLHDDLTVSASMATETQITLTSNDGRVPTDSRNTVWKMVELALAAMDVTAQVHVHIQKNLPVQGGIGAGSANAAAALLGLERELARTGIAPLPGPERLQVGEKVGSDVPLFLVGGTVYGHNRGELVLPYPDLPAMPCVVAVPDVGSSTPAAFRAWDERIGTLTPEAANDRLIQLSRVYASAYTTGYGYGGQSMTGASGVSGAIDGGSGPSSLNSDPMRSGDLAGNPLPALVRTGIENDFEEVVFLEHPHLRDILRALRGEGLPAESHAVAAALSGSGSSLFGLYRNRADAEAAQGRVQQLSGVSALLTETLPREAYWAAIFA